MIWVLIGRLDSEVALIFVFFLDLFITNSWAAPTCYWIVIQCSFVVQVSSLKFIIFRCQPHSLPFFGFSFLFILHLRSFLFQFWTKLLLILTISFDPTQTYPKEPIKSKELRLNQETNLVNTLWQTQPYIDGLVKHNIYSQREIETPLLFIHKVIYVSKSFRNQR
jgi:hypothetical protein